MQITSVVDFTGDGTAHPLSDYAGIVAATWFQLTYVTGSGTARIGDKNITSTRGIPIAAGNAQFAPPVAQAYNPYELEKIYVLVTTGDKVSLGFAI